MRDRETATANMERYRAGLHARGLCIRCRKPLERERAHRMLCAECAIQNRMQTNARRDRLRARGLCIDCGVRAPVPGQTRCRSCAIRAAEYQYKKYHGQD